MRVLVLIAAALLLLTACRQSGTYQTYSQSYEAQQAAFRQGQMVDQRAKLDSIRAGKLPKDYRKRVDAYFVGVLKDPDSRKIEFTKTPYGSLACGTINAKNSYGGYTGKQPFFAYFNDKGDVVEASSFNDEDFITTKRAGSLGDIMHVSYSLLRDCGFE